MKTKSGLAATLVLVLIPCIAFSKERGTVVAIWEQRSLDGPPYIYQVETETHFYEFLGDYPQAFQLGDSLVFTFDKDGQHVRVITQGKKTKLLLIGIVLKSANRAPGTGDTG